MSLPILQRVPWGKFLLLWFLALLMGTSLLWLHYGFTEGIVGPLVLLGIVTGLGLLWATTRARWQKAHCSWCGFSVRAHLMRYDEGRQGWVTVYLCPKCSQSTEKFKAEKEK